MPHKSNATDLGIMLFEYQNYFALSSTHKNFPTNTTCIQTHTQHLFTHIRVHKKNTLTKQKKLTTNATKNFKNYFFFNQMSSGSLDSNDSFMSFTFSTQIHTHTTISNSRNIFANERQKKTLLRNKNSGKNNINFSLCNRIFYFFFKIHKS